MFGVAGKKGVMRPVNFDKRFSFRPEGPPPKLEQVLNHRGTYDAEVRYVDHEFGALLVMLEEHRILDDAIIVVTADHGESLGERGQYFGHWDVFRETAVIPLIMVHPYRDEWRGRRVGHPVGAIDIFPTLLSWLEIDGPSCDGIDLSSYIEGGTAIERWVYTERHGTSAYALRDHDQVYVETRRPAPLSSDLFDRKALRERAALALELESFEAGALGRPKPAKVEVSEEVKERLRALGYAP